MPLRTWTSPKKAVADGDYPGVPAGSYALKVAVRTTASAADTFEVVVVVENPNAAVDVDWRQMTLDLHGHTLDGAWNADVAGSTGRVTVTPAAAAATLPARGKASFSLRLRRDVGPPAKANMQLTVKGLQC